MHVGYRVRVEDLGCAIGEHIGAALLVSGQFRQSWRIDLWVWGHQRQQCTECTVIKVTFTYEI